MTLTAVRGEVALAPPRLDPDRLAAARSALTRAEVAAGLRTTLAGPWAVPAADPPAPGAVVPSAESPGSGRHAVPPVASADLVPCAAAASSTSTPPAESSSTSTPPAEASSASAPPATDTTLPVPPALAPIFPGHALARGSVVQVTGSTAILLALAAAASTEGAWCTFAGLPHVGWRAAAAAGLPLDRVAVVPAPGPDAAAVVGALTDGFDVLVLGRCPALTERDRRLLAARVRTRGAVLLSTHPWPGAQLVLQAAGRSWTGLGQGWGHLAGQELTVRATGRAGATRAREVRVRVGPTGMLAPDRPPQSSAGPAGRTDLLVPVAPVPVGSVLVRPLRQAV